MQGGNYLIVGGDSLLGGYLAERLKASGQMVLTTTRRPGRVSPAGIFLDLNQSLGDWQPPRQIDTAVICAAVTATDRCRRDPVGSRLVNVDQTVEVARRLAVRDVFTVFLSTNLVFDGRKPTCQPNDPICPVTEYGRQKAAAERLLLETLPSVAVVRLTKILSRSTPLIANWRRELADGRVIHPFEDMVLSPVSMDDALRVILAVAAGRKGGIWQVSADRDITYAQLANRLAEKMNVDPQLVQPIKASASGLTLEVVMPNTRLDTSRIQTEFGFEPIDAFKVIDTLIK